MPVMRKYRGREDAYILTSIDGKMVTYQLMPEGQQKLERAGVEPEQVFPRALLLDLYRSGLVYTHGTGTEGELPGKDPRQLEFDFSKDTEPEASIPACGNCKSPFDLHLAEIRTEDPYFSVLCRKCRLERSSTIDSSIPLQLVNKGTFNLLKAIKGVAKTDSSVDTYQVLLEMEFQRRWDELRKRKPGSQEDLFPQKDPRQGRLI